VILFSVVQADCSAEWSGPLSTTGAYRVTETLGDESISLGQNDSTLSTSGGATC